MTRTTDQDQSGVADEGGFSTLLALALIATALLVGALYGPQILESGDLPAPVQDRLPTTSAASPVATESTPETTTERHTSVRSGRHAEFDRIVVSSVDACDFEELHDVNTFVTISCDRSLANLVWDPGRPVDAGLRNVRSWVVNDAKLVLEIEPGSSVVGQGFHGDRWILDVYDAS